MARTPRGNDNGDLGSGIADRAGAFLEINYSGASKDKRIARDLGISPGMAKMLRRGRGWTVARFEQVLGLWPGFRDFVFPPPPTADELVARLDRLVDELAQFRLEVRADLAGLREDIKNLREE